MYPVLTGLFHLAQCPQGSSCGTVTIPFLLRWTNIPLYIYIFYSLGWSSVEPGWPKTGGWKDCKELTCLVKRLRCPKVSWGWDPRDPMCSSTSSLKGQELEEDGVSSSLRAGRRASVSGLSPGGGGGVQQSSASYAALCCHSHVLLMGRGSLIMQGKEAAVVFAWMAWWS